MAEISRIDGFDVGIDSQRPQFFDGDKSLMSGVDIGLTSMQLQFFNDNSSIREFGVGIESFKGYFKVMTTMSI